MVRIKTVRGVNVYIGRQIALLLVVITLGLTFVIWLTQTVRFLDLIINRGLPLTMALYLLSLLVPELLIILLPAALFIACLFVYWRLGADSELVVLRSAGLSPWQIARPALVTSLVITALCYWLSLSLAPHANRALGNLAMDLRNDFSQVLLQAGVFTQAAPGLTVYTRNRTPDGALAGVVVYDQRPNQRQTIYTAARGLITGGPNGPAILLEDGTMQQRQSKKDPPSILIFERTLVQLGVAGNAGRTVQPRLQWLTFHQLMSPDEDTDSATRIRYRTEVHWRLSQPLFALAYVALALASLLVGSVGRRAQLWRGILAVLAVCLLQATAYAVLGVTIRSPDAWPFRYLVPLVPALLALIWLRMPWLRMPPLFRARTALP
jgi:lipopolysaccharide export system permease protein